MCFCIKEFEKQCQYTLAITAPLKNRLPTAGRGLDDEGLALLVILIQTAKNYAALCLIAPIEATAPRNEGYSVKRD